MLTCFVVLAVFAWSVLKISNVMFNVMVDRDIASAIRLLLDSVNSVFPYISGGRAREV